MASGDQAGDDPGKAVAGFLLGDPSSWAKLREVRMVVITQARAHGRQSMRGFLELSCQKASCAVLSVSSFCSVCGQEPSTVGKE